MHFLMFLEVNNMNKYNHITNKMHEIDKCVLVVKLAEQDISAEHLLLCLSCLARLVGPSCAQPLCEG